MIITHPTTGEERTVRRVTVKLNQPTLDGDEELHILTNLPARVAQADQVAELSRQRWTIERVFFDIDRTLPAEITSLGYPSAVLFGLSLAFLIDNAVSLMMTALEKAHGRSRVREHVLPYSLALEIRQAWDGINVVIAPAAWQTVAEQSVEEFAALLCELASHMHVERYQKHQRGPKMKPPPKTKYKNRPPRFHSPPHRCTNVTLNGLAPRGSACLHAGPHHFCPAIPQKPPASGHLSTNRYC